ncbi:quinolinate synthase NadA [Myxococcota bacterium]|jgi:quinolinate synthase|nr:quinolinate synthase NadA [Myxococcota bacterium]
MEAIDARVRALDPRLDLHEELSRLRRERKAVILAHYYQDDEIQDLADFTGDSLQLAQAARDTDAEVILFCGVHFMAETAKILNPSRTVVLPDLRAGCSLADSCPPQKLAALKAAHPDHVVVSYINCTAETKALSDWICTSSNARRVIDAIPADQKIIFAPDRNLGAWLMRETGREMLLWQGSCIVHETFSERKLIELRSQHPDAVVLAHPECEPEILQLADVIGSTFALLRATQTMAAQRFIVATEPGIIHQMRKVNPQKEYIPLPGRDTTCACNECPFMRLNTLEKMVLALRDLEPRIEMSEDLRLAALKPLERMLALG